MSMDAAGFCSSKIPPPCLIKIIISHGITLQPALTPHPLLDLHASYQSPLMQQISPRRPHGDVNKARDWSLRLNVKIKRIKLNLKTPHIFCWSFWLSTLAHERRAAGLGSSWGFDGHAGRAKAR
jgi:hypothetical protein